MNFSLFYNLIYVLPFLFAENKNANGILLIEFTGKNIVHQSNLKYFQSDTTKQVILISNCYVICGSFLVPRNAEKQLAKLKKSGFTKTYIHNFPESEYYSVVVDTFVEDNSIKPLIIELSTHKYDYFIKCQ